MASDSENGSSYRFPGCEARGCTNESTTLLELSGATKDEMLVCGDDECHPFWIGAGAPSIDSRATLTIAPQHGVDLIELDPYIIEGVAYSPLKVHSLHNYGESLELRCDSCEWTATVGELPEDSGRIQPDMCPDCAKVGELGFVRCESPADGSFPVGWNQRNGRQLRTDT